MPELDFQNRFLKFNNFLCICWFLAKNISNFVSLPWKLHNRYCHIPQGILAFILVNNPYVTSSAMLGWWAKKSILLKILILPKISLLLKLFKQIFEGSSIDTIWDPIIFDIIRWVAGSIGNNPYVTSSAMLGWWAKKSILLKILEVLKNVASKNQLLYLRHYSPQFVFFQATFGNKKSCALQQNFTGTSWLHLCQ